MVTTLDQISAGRLELGIGAGGTNRAERQKNLGYDYEFDAYDIMFPKKPSTRIEKLDEGLTIMKKMWNRDVASFNGKHYRIKNAICLPKPVQKPHPPIWIGGRGGPKIMTVIVKHANGWNISGASTVEDYRKKLTTLKKACAKIGRSVDEIKTSVGVNGSVKECREKMKRLWDEGLDLAILRLPRGKEIEYIRQLRE
jgi:alkanesulfonate monooxygenase SsuD/methylene tetrahydromethanopterin reductase-like flavin-dependent oxidoreductase (luciferase family)